MAEKDNQASGDQLEEMIEEKEQKLDVPTKLPVLLLRDMVVFPVHDRSPLRRPGESP